MKLISLFPWKSFLLLLLLHQKFGFLFWQGRDSTTPSWGLDTGTRLTPESIKNILKEPKLEGGKYSTWREQLQTQKTT
jgi:hypothetical protein